MLHSIQSIYVILNIVTIQKGEGSAVVWRSCEVGSSNHAICIILSCPDESRLEVEDKAQNILKSTLSGKKWKLKCCVIM